MIVELLICFFLATTISFFGSVQFGPVNLRVIQAAYDYNFRAAMLVAAGGMLPEIIYSAIAIWSSWLLLSNPLWYEALQIAAIPFFLISGILVLLKKNTIAELKPASGHTLFVSGFLAGIMNPMLFTFWFMVTNFLVTGNFITLDNLPNSMAFVAGTAFGALLLLKLFAWLTQKHRRFLEQRLSGNLNKLVGVIFIILAVVQFIKWMQ